VDVAIVDGRLLVKESRSNAAVRVAQRAVAGQSAMTRLRAAGLTQQEALETLALRPLQVNVLDPGARDRERDTGMLGIGVLILFAALLIYGQSVASSVTEEKSSRVIELLLTSVAPRRLLAGKVLGVGALGVAQVITVCSAGLISARIAGGEGLPPSARGTVALVVGWFVLGFAFYSVAYSALGALVSRQEDLDATTAPVNVLLIATYFGANAAIENPDGTWAQIAAFLPPVAPLIVPTRVVLGDMGAVGLIASVAVSLLATFLLIRVAAGIYERSILRVGAPISLRSALAAGGVATDHVRVDVPPAMLQGAAVAALIGGGDRRHGPARRHRPDRRGAGPHAPPPIRATPPAHASVVRTRRFSSCHRRAGCAIGEPSRRGGDCDDGSDADQPCAPGPRSHSGPTAAACPRV
jgi:ABC-2 type transport system permease protein